MGINAIAIGPDLSARNAGRKADREAIARALIGVAEKHGAQIERRDEPRHPGYHSGSIYLRFTLAGVGAMVNVDAIHGGDYALIHWHNSECGARHFANGFPGASGRPHHKATAHPQDWEGLANALDRGLSLAVRGEAFQEVSLA